MHNQPRTHGDVADLIENEIERFAGLIGEIAQIARGRVAKTVEQGDARGRVLLAYHLETDCGWSAIVGDSLEALCASKRPRIVVEGEAAPAHAEH